MSLNTTNVNTTSTTSYTTGVAEVDNCNACRTNTCTEVYHKTVHDEGRSKGFMEKVSIALGIGLALSDACFRLRILVFPFR